MKVLDGLLVKSLGLVIETWDQIRPLHIKRGVSGLGVCVGVPSEFVFGFAGMCFGCSIIAVIPTKVISRQIFA
jgi:hypothetical protein